MTENAADSPKVSRIERRKIEFRDKITAAALKLFEQNGIAETSVASIIKEADIAHKTFFNHFPTKDHLLQHIASNFSGDAYDIFREGFKRLKDPKKRVEYCLMSIANAVNAVNPHYKELLNFYLISGTGSNTIRKEQQEQFSAIIQQIISEAKAEGKLKPGLSIDTYTDIVVGICVATLLNWSLEDDFPIVSKMKQAVKFLNNSLFVNGR